MPVNPSLSDDAPLIHKPPPPKNMGKVALTYIYVFSLVYMFVLNFNQTLECKIPYCYLIGRILSNNVEYIYRGKLSRDFDTPLAKSNLERTKVELLLGR